jgi:hypothetical protein
MGEFKYFTLGVGIIVVLLGAIAGAAIGAISSGPPSPVAAKTPMSHTQSTTKQSAGMPQPESKSASGMGVTTVDKHDAGERGVLHLTGMPAGTVRVWRNPAGRLEAELDVYGLTPGSSHGTSIDAPDSTPASPEVRFPAFTADRAGRATMTLTATSTVGALASGSRFSIRLGTYTSSGASSPAAELIGGSGVLPAQPNGSVSALFPRSFGPTGTYIGRLHGWTRMVYSRSTRTLSVTVTAYGLAPGTHAAHVHLGSCEDQGAVKYMLMDFQADASGNIVNQTRTVRPVAPAPPATGWYLNVHLGNSASILAKGMPTLNFRPELCSDVTSVATTSHR